MLTDIQHELVQCFVLEYCYCIYFMMRDETASTFGSEKKSYFVRIFISQSIFISTNEGYAVSSKYEL